jgi:hypothetical protein
LERKRQASKGLATRTAAEEAHVLQAFGASTLCDDESFLLAPMKPGADGSIAVNQAIPQGIEYRHPEYQSHSATHLSSLTV